MLEQSILACISAGCFGSLFSLLQRNSTVPLNLTGGGFYTFLQSLFICVLGALSGAALYLLCISGLALSVAKENLAMLTVFAMIAGFSERMIPDLFNKMQKEQQE
ncbi:hypothetical protein [Shewanella halifaxensis]|uniref:hypothetical protein n=1 Tax=Shewanella halifaxensis TaxID=271098 RepID=UPI0013A5FC99|nr:hypothetical protein [Shewanella halifaxensis]